MFVFNGFSFYKYSCGGDAVTDASKSTGTSHGKALTCPNTLKKSHLSHGIKQAKIQMFIGVIIYFARDLEKAKKEESERSVALTDREFLMLLMGSGVSLSLTHIIETCFFCLYFQTYLSRLYHSWERFTSAPNTIPFLIVVSLLQSTPHTLSYTDTHTYTHN